MRRRLVALAGLLLLALASPASAQTSITVSPVTQYFPFNFNNNATFSCEVVGTALIWEVNDFQLSSEEALDFVTEVYVEDGAGSGLPGLITRTSTLKITVPGSGGIDRNDTNIRCLARGDTDTGTIESDNIYLRTFSTPGVPPNLDIALVSNPSLPLTLIWDRPGNLPGPDNVPVTYTVEAVSDSAANYPGFPMSANSTLLNFADINECTVYTFSVTASADSLTGNASSITETVPISPDMTLVTAGLVGKVSFSGQNPMLTMTFPAAETCSNSRFPIVRYAVNVNGQEVNVTGLSSPLSVFVSAADVTGFSSGEAFALGCINVTCRPSGSITFFTSSVQETSILYFGSRVLFSCVLVSGAPARGCVFRFQLPPELSDGAPPEDIFVPATSAIDVMLTPNRARALPSNQDGTCEMTQNSVDVYRTITVFDWEAGGGVGTQGPAPRQTNVSTEDEPNFVCQPPSSGLSEGAIAGIIVLCIIVVLVLIAAVVGMILLLCYYKDKLRKRIPMGKRGISLHHAFSPRRSLLPPFRIIPGSVSDDDDSDDEGEDAVDYGRSSTVEPATPDVGASLSVGGAALSAGRPIHPLQSIPMTLASLESQKSMKDRSIGHLDMTDPDRFMLKVKKQKLQQMWQQTLKKTQSADKKVLLYCNIREDTSLQEHTP